MYASCRSKDGVSRISRRQFNFRYDAGVPRLNTPITCSRNKIETGKAKDRCPDGTAAPLAREWRVPWENTEIRVKLVEE